MLSSRKCIAALLLLLLHIALPPGAAAFNQWMYLPQTPQDARGLDCNPRPTQAKSTSQQPVMGPWFPMRKADLDCFGKTLDAGVEIDADHPGFRVRDSCSHFRYFSASKIVNATTINFPSEG